MGTLAPHSDLPNQKLGGCGAALCSNSPPGHTRTPAACVLEHTDHLAVSHLLPSSSSSSTYRQERTTEVASRRFSPLAVASTVVAVGRTIAAAGFASCYVLQAMKHLEPQVKQVFQSLPESAFCGGYSRDGYYKMMKRDAAHANTGRIRDAHGQITLLNHPDQGAFPYIVAKINEAKDFLEQWFLTFFEKRQGSRVRSHFKYQMAAF
ncbi:LOW QUALITY PROTEIN: mitochondrial import inner membrane translocase subunit TIM14-like [Rhynchonycteris naso]